MVLEHDEFVVTFDPSRGTPDALIEAIRQVGYSARIVTAGDTVSTALEPVASLPGGFPELDAALVRAAREHKPLLVDFYAKWCVPCRRMTTETFTKPTVKRLLDKCVLVTIDTDQHPEIARRFGVTALPDIRIVRPDGSITAKLVGFQSPDDLARALKAVIDVVR